LFRSALLVFAAAAAAPAQVPNRLCSSDSAQGFSNDHSARTHTDASGRFVVFQSDASNLVAGDTNGRRDVFLKDLGTGLTHLISVGLNGAPANNDSYEPRISGSGRYVAFTSRASNLVLNDQNGATTDVFVYDRQLATMTLASRNHLGVAGNDNSSWGSISDDGRYVAYQSLATGMVPGGVGNGVMDAYLRDLVTGIVTLVSHDGAGGPGNAASNLPRISRNGQFVCFESSASNLVAGDTNGRRDIYTFDRISGTVTRTSLGPGGVEPDGDCRAPEPTGLGLEIAYESFATNLVAGDTNNSLDVFVSSNIGASTVRVSVASGGAELNDSSLQPHISDNGQYVVFVTRATDAYPGASGLDEIAWHDRVSGITERASISLLGGAPNGSCQFPAVSDDGRYVAFVSSAPNLLFGKLIALRDAIRADLRPPVVAAAQTFGVGCPGSNGLVPFGPGIGALPWLGTSFSLEGTNAPPLGVGIVIIGFSDSLHQGVALPAPLDFVGMRGCSLLVSIEITELVFADGAGAFAHPLQIPNDLIWRGFQAYAQAWVVDPPANAGGAITTNGVAFTIGG